MRARFSFTNRRGGGRTQPPRVAFPVSFSSFPSRQLFHSFTLLRIPISLKMCYDEFASQLEETLGMTPTQLLGMAVKKRRELNAVKDRSYRLELLQNAFIQSLCKHLGERRARRRARKFEKSSETVSSCENMRKNESPSDEVSQARVVPVIQTPEPPQKRVRTVDETDPFGLNAFFHDVRTSNQNSGGSFSLFFSFLSNRKLGYPLRNRILYISREFLFCLLHFPIFENPTATRLAMRRANQ